MFLHPMVSEGWHQAKSRNSRSLHVYNVLERTCTCVSHLRLVHFFEVSVNNPSTNFHGSTKTLHRTSPIPRVGLLAYLDTPTISMDISASMFHGESSGRSPRCERSQIPSGSRSGETGALCV